MSDQSSAIGSVFAHHLASARNSHASKGSGDTSFADMISALDEKTKDVTTPSLSKSEPTAAEKFLKYQNMTMAEKIRASYLSDMHLTEDDVKAMSPEERAKIEQKIAEKIKEQLAKATGGSVKEPALASAGVSALVAGAGI